MTVSYSVARTMELLGLRWISLGMARLLGLPYLPSVRQMGSSLEYSSEELTETCRVSKYFAVGNLIRLGFGAPILVALFFAKSPIVFSLFAVLMVLHLLLLISDSYRLAVASALLPLGKSGSRSLQPAEAKPIKPHFYFSLRSFETARFYRAIGAEWAQGRVTWWDSVMRRTAKEKQESQSFQYLRATSLEDLIRFEAATRSAETAHLTTALVNLVATFVLALRLSPAAIFGAATVWFDCGLVVLQRYSRARVTQLIGIMERKAARAKRATS